MKHKTLKTVNIGYQLTSQAFSLNSREVCDSEMKNSEDKRGKKVVYVFEKY